MPNFHPAFNSLKKSIPVFGCICISPNNRILLVRNRMGQKWSFPKGHKEKYDRTALACALRELKEETGISLEQEYLITKKYLAAEYFIYSVPEEYRPFPQDMREVDAADWFTFEEMCALNKNIDVSLFCQHIQKKIIPSIPSELPVDFLAC